MPPKEKSDCNACGSRKFSINDGFMYCDTCGALQEDFIEEELDAGDDDHIAGCMRIKTKKGRSKSGEKKTGGRKRKSNFDHMKETLARRSDFFATQFQYNENIAFESSPEHLYRVGLRIATFTQILRKSVFIMINDMKFPEALTDVSLAILQEYLKTSEVAFCSEEIAETEEERIISVMKNEEYEKEMAALKKKKVAEAKTKGIKKLNESQSPWQLLTQGSINENLELDDDEDEEEEEVTKDETTANDTAAFMTTKYLKEIKTHLSKRAVKRASHMFLNLEILATILYLSSLSIGCTNLLLSDVVRWIREDRFRISAYEISLCARGGYEKLNKKLGQGEANSLMDYRLSYLQIPMYEINRTFMLFNQSVDLSKNMGEIKFEKLCARIIDHLNLPTEMLTRMIYIESKIKCDLDIYSRRQANVENGWNLLELFNMVPRLLYDEFTMCLGKKDLETYDKAAEDIPISKDTKIMAYLLFVIKLTFDLETEETKQLDIEGFSFDIDTWIHQLEMRIMYWQGHDLQPIFRSTCRVPTLQEEMPFDNNYFPFPTISEEMILQFRRKAFFRSSLPSQMSISSTQNLPTVFESRDDLLKKERNQMEAIISPLKFQQKILKKELERLSIDEENKLDQQSIDTFFINFKNSKITGLKDNFEDLFPASQNYVKYTRPDFTSKCTIRKRRLKEEGKTQIYLSSRVCDDLFVTASRVFSPRFKLLLEKFAQIIGEHEKILYAAFCMLETSFLEEKRLDKYRKILMDKHETIELPFLQYNIKGKFQKFELQVSAGNDIDNIEELNMFYFSLPHIIFNDDDDEEAHEDEEKEEKEEDNEEVEYSDSESSENDEIDEIRKLWKMAKSEKKSEQWHRKQQRWGEDRKYLRKAFFNFEKIFSLLTIKYW